MESFNLNNNNMFNIPQFALNTPINILSLVGYYLSCAEFDNIVYFSSNKSMRQFWILEQDSLNDEEYYIKSAILRYNHTQYLGCPNKNNKVYLYTSKNKYTKWKIKNIKNNIYSIDYIGTKFDKNLVELVVSRYNENINWVYAYNDIATVYNKGIDNISNIDNIIKLPNIGREGNTYLFHIINKYEDLKEKTVFSQGEPFTHNETFLFGIDNIEKTLSVQPLGLRYLKEINIPSSEYIEVYETTTNYGLVYLRACCDGDLIIPYFNDDGINHLKKTAKLHYPGYSNLDLVSGFFQRANFPYFKSITDIYFTYSGLFSVNKNKILKLDKYIYINLYNELTSLDSQGGTNGYVLERLWLYIFE